LLAFGDDLTAGCYACGHLFAPYAAALGPQLLPEVVTDIYVNGLSGMTAARLSKRLDADGLKDSTGRVGKGLRRALEDDGPFDLALIMVGTVDLVEGRDPRDISESIRALHEACHQQGTRTVAFAVPQSKAATNQARLATRHRALNRLLEEWASRTAEGQDGEQSVMGFVDTSSLVPFSDDSVLWEPDGLHLSRAGSSWLGSQLAAIVRPLLAGDRAPVARVGAGAGPRTAGRGPGRLLGLLLDGGCCSRRAPV